MEDGTVSREAMIAALMDGEAMLARAGGVLSVITQREPTEFPGEMVTTAAVFEWKDRTDARPQPETTAPVVTDPVHDFDLPDVPYEEDREEVLAQVDGAEMPEEDLDSIPAEMR